MTPRASVSVIRPVTACGRRCWRQMDLKVPRIRSKGVLVSSTPWVRPPNRAALLDGFGESWELSKNSYKPYPGGIVIHPVIDCVLDLRRAKALASADIERIIVHGHPLLSDRANRPNVTSGREAQVSVQHSVAAALLFGKAGLDEYTDACVRDPAVLELRRKVELRQDATIPVEAATVDVVMKNGNWRTMRLFRPRVAAPSDRSAMANWRTSCSRSRPRWDQKTRYAGSPMRSGHSTACRMYRLCFRSRGLRTH